MEIRLKGIKKAYKNRVVLDIESICFEKGKIFAVLGPNGSGKTTLLRILAGMEKPDEGSVFYDGDENFPQKFIAYMPQKCYMFDMTVMENIMLGISKKGHQARETAGQALQCIGMEGYEKRKASVLSGGESQKVAAARTLVTARKLIILDEPTSSVDIVSMTLIENYIKLVNREYGSTVVFSTHNPSQAVRIADEVIMLWDGRPIGKGMPKEVLVKPHRREIDEFMRCWRI